MMGGGVDTAQIPPPTTTTGIGLGERVPLVSTDHAATGPAAERSPFPAAASQRSRMERRDGSHFRGTARPALKEKVVVVGWGGGAKWGVGGTPEGGRR